MVGVAGFEPTAFRSQSGRATKLRHTPSGARRRVHGRTARVGRILRGGARGACDPNVLAQWTGDPLRCLRAAVTELRRSAAGVAQW
ncbi:hypothetical protein SGPA1_30450 [Streptomyces misionensis JCM 4497]